MAPFDIVSAMNGARVCTENGSKVRILDFNLYNPTYKIVAAVKKFMGLGFDDEQIICYDETGCMYDNLCSGLKLMMADDDYLEKLERGEYSTSVNDAPVWQEPHKIKGRIVTCDKMSNKAFNSEEDEKYWRKTYAGMAMKSLIIKEQPYETCNDTVKQALLYANALISQLKKYYK